MLKTIPELIQSIRTDLRCVTAQQAQQEMSENKGLLIDVREPHEFAEQGVAAALNIPRGLLEMKMLSQFPDEHKPIYIHCATGARATLAAEQLKRVGYEKVTVITCDLETVCMQW